MKNTNLWLALTDLLSNPFLDRKSSIYKEVINVRNMFNNLSIAFFFEQLRELKSQVSHKEAVSIQAGGIIDVGKHIYPSVLINEIDFFLNDSNFDLSLNEKS